MEEGFGYARPAYREAGTVGTQAAYTNGTSALMLVQWCQY